MTQKQDEKEVLLCTYKDCEEPQGGENEFCIDHQYKAYKVIWEVSKYAEVEAQSEEDAIEKVNDGEAKEYEDEITMPMEAYLKKY